MSDINYTKVEQTADNILTAISTLVENKVSTLQFDKTVQAKILNCTNKNTGEYRVRYQDSVMYAYSQNLEVTYSTNDQVYVLVPHNDFTERKTILGTVEKLGTEYSTIWEDEDLFEKLSGNLIRYTRDADQDKEFALSSYNSGEISLHDTFYLEQEEIELYKEKATALLIAAEFKTTIPEEQRFGNGQYGLYIKGNYWDPTVPEDNRVEEDKIPVEFRFSSLDMHGVPYEYNNWSRQYTIIPLTGKDFDTFSSNINFWVDYFPNQDAIQPQDIYVRNPEIYLCESIDLEKLNGTYVYITAPYGGYFTQSTIDTTKIFQANIRDKGRMINLADNSYEIYWFIQNNSIDETSEYYHQYGGSGWQCLNTKEDGIWRSGSYRINITADMVQAMETYFKVAIVYSDNILTSEKIFYNRIGNEVKIESSNGTLFHQSVGLTTLTCKVNDLILNDYQYSWMRSVDGNALQLLEYTTPQIPNIEIRDCRESLVYYVTVTHNNTLYGSAKIVLTNDPSRGEYYVVIKNGNQVFKYTEEGYAPNSNSVDKKNRITTKALSFDIYNAENQKIELTDDEKVHKCQIKWQVPNPEEQNSLIAHDYNVEEYNVLNTDNTIETRYIVKNTANFIFDINSYYDITKTDNEIRLDITFNNIPMTAQTRFSFLKEGMSGTNGTNFTARVVPADDRWDGVFIHNNIWYGWTKDNEDITIQQLSNANTVCPLKIEIWNGGELPLRTTADTSTLNSIGATWKWEVVPYVKENNKNRRISINNSNQIIVNSKPTNSSDLEQYNAAGCTILKGTITDPTLVANGVVKSYYAWYPLNISFGSYIPVVYSGYNSVMYGEDGVRGRFSDDIFRIAWFTERVSGTTYSYTRNDYQFNQLTWTCSWKSGNLLKYDRRFSAATGEDYDELVNSVASISIDPLLKYDAIVQNNYIRCQANATSWVDISVHYYLNAFGKTYINEWDGNSIEINKDEKYILSPQVGAGAKDSNNAFTGVLLGKTFDRSNRNATQEENGIFMYDKGERTGFWDASNGSMYIGRSGYGQIQLLPNNTDYAQVNNYGNQVGHAILRSGDFDANANSSIGTTYIASSTEEQRKKIQEIINDKYVKDSYNATRNKYKQTYELNYENTTGQKNGGMEIDLTAPYIRWVNGNFSVNSAGNMYAQNAFLEGTIYAQEGLIGDWWITAAGIQNKLTSPTVWLRNAYTTTEEQEYKDGFRTKYETHQPEFRLDKLWMTGDGHIWNNKRKAGTTNTSETKNDAGWEYKDPLTNNTIHSGYIFEVTNDGNLYAQNAYLSGTITSSRGSIGGWVIGEEGFFKGYTSTTNTDGTQVSVAVNINNSDIYIKSLQNKNDNASTPMVRFRNFYICPSGEFYVQTSNATIGNSSSTQTINSEGQTSQLRKVFHVTKTGYLFAVSGARLGKWVINKQYGYLAYVDDTDTNITKDANTYEANTSIGQSAYIRIGQLYGSATNTTSTSTTRDYFTLPNAGNVTDDGAKYPEYATSHGVRFSTKFNKISIAKFSAFEIGTDGSFYAGASKNLWFNAATGKLYVKGEIEASVGRFGRWWINQKALDTSNDLSVNDSNKINKTAASGALFYYTGSNIPNEDGVTTVSNDTVPYFLGEMFEDTNATSYKWVAKFKKFRVRNDGSVFFGKDDPSSNSYSIWIDSDGHARFKNFWIRNTGQIFSADSGDGFKNPPAATQQYKNPITRANLSELHYKFEVTKDGILYAHDANIQGNLYSENAYLGGWIIDDKYIRNSSSSIFLYSQATGKNNAARFGNFYINADGTIFNNQQTGGLSNFLVNDQGYMQALHGGQIGQWYIAPNDDPNWAGVLYYKASETDDNMSIYFGVQNCQPEDFRNAFLPASGGKYSAILHSGSFNVAKEGYMWMYNSIDGSTPFYILPDGTGKFCHWFLNKYNLKYSGGSIVLGPEDENESNHSIITMRDGSFYKALRAFKVNALTDKGFLVLNNGAGCFGDPSSTGLHCILGSDGKFDFSGNGWLGQWQITTDTIGTAKYTRFESSNTTTDTSIILNSSGLLEINKSRKNWVQITSDALNVVYSNANIFSVSADETTGDSHVIIHGYNGKTLTPNTDNDKSALSVYGTIFNNGQIIANQGTLCFKMDDDNTSSVSFGHTGVNALSYKGRVAFVKRRDDVSASGGDEFKLATVQYVKAAIVALGAAIRPRAFLSHSTTDTLAYQSDIPKDYITKSDLSNYATQSWVDNNYQKKGSGGGGSSSSDKKLKTNIQPLEQTKIKNIYQSIKPVSFNFINDENTTYGFIANELVDALVQQDINWAETNLISLKEEDKTYLLDYKELHAFHATMIQSQQQEIENLNQKNETLQQQVTELNEKLNSVLELLNELKGEK